MWERVGPRARDLAFVVSALLAVFADTMTRRHQAFAVWSVVGAAGSIGSVVLWWRRRYPVTVTLIGLAVVAATGLPFVAMVGLFTLAVQHRNRVLAAVSAVAIVVVTLTWSVGTATGWARLVTTATLVVGFFVAAGAYVGARRDLVAALRERAERAEAHHAVRAEQARMAERSRIAHELHDVLAHKVSLVALHAGALEVQSSPTAEHVTASAELIRTTAREAMEDLREVLGVLRPSLADTASLSPPPRRDDIARVVEASRAAGVQAELRMDLDEMPDPIARAAYRIVREGLTNVHKHARGAATTVTVAGGETTGVSIEVVNRPPIGGAALLPGAGVGLLGLAERVGLLGGTLESGPCADGDWRLAAWLPWSHE
jgi:signal transduction histidine kinase